MIGYYDFDGEPISLEEWSALFAARSRSCQVGSRWQVGETEIDGYRVSTVWLGLDHSFGLGGPPLIFETMVFGDDWEGEDQWRWSTETDARAGHEAACDLVRLWLAAGRPGSAAEGSPAAVSDDPPALEG